MKLPIEISPNPLVTSAIEIRFLSELESDKVLTTFFPIFSQELPILKEGKIPKELKSLKNDIKEFKYAADFTLSNEDYLISFSNNAIAFEVVGEYKFWANYFTFIKKQLSKLFQTSVINSIERIGLRYASIFQNASINDILKYYPSLGVEGYEEKISIFRTNLSRNNYQMHLQIANNAKVNKNNKTFSGVVIDIDASASGNLDPKQHSIIFDKIDELHKLEKELFFELLKPDFLQTLKPKY